MNTEDTRDDPWEKLRQEMAPVTESWNAHHDYIQSIMTPELAQEVKRYRIELELTWRMVAGVIADNHPELDLNSGNQIDGMYLCEAASALLNENWDT